MKIVEQQKLLVLSENSETQERIPVGMLTRGEGFVAKNILIDGKYLSWSRTL